MILPVFRDDYIAEIQVVCGNAHEFPGDQGWELLDRTFSGKRRRDGHPVGAKIRL